MALSQNSEQSKKYHLNKVGFLPSRPGDFTHVLKQRVDQYFLNANISKHANFHMLAKTVFYFGGWIFLCGLTLSQPFLLWQRIVVMMILGFFGAGIGFNVGHDAIHGAYSSHPLINKWVSLAFEAIGANAYTWRIRHNVLHHTFTNVVGSDGDLESMPLLRFCVKPGRKNFHAYQHWYAPLLYCFTSLVWVFKKDYAHILEERRDQRLKRPPAWHVYVSLVGFKFLHYFLFLLYPIFVLQLPVWQVLLSFLAMHFVLGFMLAMVFQLGHCVEGPDFHDFPADGKMTSTWAEHQLKTSSNFGTHFINTWICGGLNYQTEHHLFSNICHVHYAALAPIVKQTAQEFHLPYHEHKSFFAGVRSHLRALKYFGTHDPVVAIS